MTPFACYTDRCMWTPRERLFSPPLREAAPETQIKYNRENKDNTIKVPLLGKLLRSTHRHASSVFDGQDASPGTREMRFGKKTHKTNERTSSERKTWTATTTERTKGGRQMRRSSPCGARWQPTRLS